MLTISNYCQQNDIIQESCLITEVSVSQSGVCSIEATFSSGNTQRSLEGMQPVCVCNCTFQKWKTFHFKSKWCVCSKIHYNYHHTLAYIHCFFYWSHCSVPYYIKSNETFFHKHAIHQFWCQHSDEWCLHCKNKNSECMQVTNGFYHEPFFIFWIRSFFHGTHSVPWWTVTVCICICTPFYNSHMHYFIVQLAQWLDITSIV